MFRVYVSLRIHITVTHKVSPVLNRHFFGCMYLFCIFLLYGQKKLQPKGTKKKGIDAFEHFNSTKCFIRDHKFRTD